MSTKCSELYGEGFHYYFDYKDYEYHLVFGKKEITIPEAFKDTLNELCTLKKAEEDKIRSIKKLHAIEENPFRKLGKKKLEEKDDEI